MWQETSRWVRVGALSISALSPFINILLARLRANVEAEEAVLQLQKDELEDVVQSDGREINLDWQERLQAVNATINDLLLDLQETPYGQRFQQQSEDFRERGKQLSQAIAERRNDLRERSSQLSQAVAERSNQFAQDLAGRRNELRERSSQLTQDLAERGSRLTQDLAERGGEISHELTQRTRRARRQLAARDRNFWILLGFGTGLVATAVITYLFIRRRLQRAAEEEPPIQLSYSDTDVTVENAVNGRGNIYSVGANGATLEAQTAGIAEDDVLGTASETNFSPLSVDETPEAVSSIEIVEFDDESSEDDIPSKTKASEAVHPVNAAFVGVSSTKQYYPAETPLDQLHNGEVVDVIYFASEDEAQQQGFSAATL
jgi:hypothetical protein